MEEPKKFNDSSVDQPVTTAAPKNISTRDGILIILIAAVIIGIGIFYFFRTSSVKEFSADPESLKVSAPEEKNADVGLPDSKQIPTPTETEEEDAEPAGEETLDFDYELKKLDEQNNSVDSDDFDENEMSDANVGL